MANTINKTDNEATPDSPAPRVQLAQWRTLRAVVEAGSYARAARQLHKSQSAVTYAVQKLEQTLGVKVFELAGRRAVLTAAGHVLYRRAGSLLEDAGALEKAARELTGTAAAQVRLAVDTMFPTWLLLETLARFARTHLAPHVDLFETVLGGSEEALTGGKVDLAITPIVPTGFMGDPLMRLRFIAVAAPDHPLHQLQRPLTRRDLRKHRQLVIRDSARERRHDVGWLGAESRWTVANKATSIRAAQMGLGFAWYPEESVRAELAAGTLKQLPLREGGERFAYLSLVLATADYAGPTVMHLADLLRQAVTGQDND